MKWLFVLATLAAGCTLDYDGDDGDDGGSGSGSGDRPDPATCPAEPFEHCGVHDNGWDVWCENGIVYANDMTANAYCFPGTHEVACMVGGMSISQQYMCASTCATTEKLYFDFSSDYINFDKSSLCTH